MRSLDQKIEFSGSMFCRRRISILWILYRILVILRSKKLIDDAASEPSDLLQKYLRCFPHAIQAEYGRFPVQFGELLPSPRRSLIAAVRRGEKPCATLNAKMQFKRAAEQDESPRHPPDPNG